jgi:protein subunit release factor B
MSGFAVGLDKEKALAEKMSCLGISQEDIIEKFVKSGGPGGQNVNKTSTCVYLKHIPTGIEVKCQQERSQALNRYFARQMLVKKIEKTILGVLSEERQRIEKIKRQKRRRARRLKLKILEEKRLHSEKKRLRARIRQIE